MSVLSPREIVAELDRYIVGQGAAKRALAIALRDRLLSLVARHRRYSPSAGSVHSRLSIRFSLRYEPARAA